MMGMSDLKIKKLFCENFTANFCYTLPVGTFLSFRQASHLLLTADAI